jgi:hypothetical protein
VVVVSVDIHDEGSRASVNEDGGPNPVNDRALYTPSAVQMRYDTDRPAFSVEHMPDAKYHQLGGVIWAVHDTRYESES